MLDRLKPIFHRCAPVFARYGAGGPIEPAKSDLGRLAVSLLLCLGSLPAQAETPPKLAMEAQDLPDRPGIGRLGFHVFPAGPSGSAARLVEFGVLNERVGFSELAGRREDGLVRRHERFTELESAVLAVADLAEPFVVLAGRRVENNLVTPVVELRHGPMLAEQALLFPEIFSPIRSVALIDPVAPDDFDYLLAGPSVVYRMHSSSSEPLWERLIDFVSFTVSLRPDPKGPTVLAVGAENQLILLDPDTGDELDAWPLSAAWGLAVARLSADGGEQLLVVGPPPQGILAFDVLSGEPLWSIPTESLAAVHVHDLSGDGLDEILLTRTIAPDWERVIEWRDAAGQLLQQGSIDSPFRHAVVFDLLGEGEPQVLLDPDFASAGNPLLSLDLASRYPQARAEPSNFARFHARRDEQGALVIETAPGIHPFPEPYFQPRLRSVDAASAGLRWVAELDPAQERFIVDVTGLDPGEPDWQFGSVYVLSRLGNSSVGGRITELEATTGQVLRRRELDLGGAVAYRLLAFDTGDGAGLVLVSFGTDGTRFHRVDPQSLQLAWSSPALALGFAGGEYRLEVAENALLISEPMAGFNGTRLLDLETGDVLFDPGPGVMAAALMRDADARLLMVTQDAEQVLRLLDTEQNKLLLETPLAFRVSAMAAVDPALLLLAESDRVHLFHLHGGGVVCSSARQASGLGVAKGFLPDPSRDHRWLIGNSAGVHGILVKPEAKLFSDRFEHLTGEPGCAWQ